MNVVVVVGNPKRESRTLSAACELATAVAGRPPDSVFDLADFGPRLLDWQDHSVCEAVETVGRSSIAIIASPTFKGTYSGLLKLFLDRFTNVEGLSGVSAVPLMLGASLTHAMAPDLLLKPVLVELGATCAAPGLFADTGYKELDTLRNYERRWGPTLRAASEENEQ